MSGPPSRLRHLARAREIYTPARAGLLLCALVAAVRLVNWLAARADPYIGYRAGDEAYFHDWAVAIAQGSPGRDEVFFTSPLFAYVLAPLTWLAGDGVGPVIALNIVFGALSVLLIHRTAHKVAGTSAALIATAVAGLCVAPVYYELFTEKTALVLFLTALCCFLISAAILDGGRGRWAAAGGAVGLAALAHPLLLVMLPAAAIGLLLQVRSARAAAGPLALFCAAAAGAILPATAHNYFRGGDLVLICTNGGQNFYVGNHAGNQTGLYTSPPFSYAAMESEESNFKEEAQRRAGRPLRPSEVSSFWFRQGLREAAADPLLSLTRVVRRLRWALGDEELTDTRNMGFFRGRLPVFALPLWGFGVVSFLGLAGASLLFREPKVRFLLLFPLLYLLGMSLFVVLGRLRLPLLVPFSVLAGAGVVEVRRRLAQRRARDLAVRLPLLGAFLWLSFAKVLPGTGESFFIDYFNMGNRYLGEGRVDEAIEEFEKALWVRPGNHPATTAAILGLADLYVRRGDPEAADRLIQRAVRAGRLTLPADPGK